MKLKTVRMLCWGIVAVEAVCLMLHAVLPGEQKMLFIGMLALLAVLAVLAVGFLRCPHCGGHIHLTGMKHCPTCGKKIEE